MTQPKCGKCNTLRLPGFPCSTCDPAAFERHRAAFNGLTVGNIAPRKTGSDAADWHKANHATLTTGRFAPRKTGPYSAEELAGMRALTEHHDPTGMTRRLLATLDAREAERDAMADAVRALLDVLPSAALQCGKCDGLATLSCLTPSGGVLFYCDDHAPEGATEMAVAAPLRALRALLADPSLR